MIHIIYANGKQRIVPAIMKYLLLSDALNYSMMYITLMSCMWAAGDYFDVLFLAIISACMCLNVFAFDLQYYIYIYCVAWCYLFDGGNCWWSWKSSWNSSSSRCNCWFTGPGNIISILFTLIQLKRLTHIHYILPYSGKFLWGF